MNSKDPVTVRPDGVEVVGVAEGDNGGLAARRRCARKGQCCFMEQSWQRFAPVLQWQMITPPLIW
jgi:hypothetical protein